MEFPWGEDDRLKEHRFQNSLTDINRTKKKKDIINYESHHLFLTNTRQYYLHTQFTKTDQLVHYEFVLDSLSNIPFFFFTLKFETKRIILTNTLYFIYTKSKLIIIN